MSLRFERRIEAHQLNTRRITNQDMRRRRIDESNLLRKEKREENLRKRRKDSREESIVSMNSETNEGIAKCIQDMYSQDPAVVTEAITNIRKMLSVEEDPPIDDCINAGIVPRLIECLRLDEYPTLQFETAWILTNLASGDSKQTAVIVDADVIPHLIRLLASPHENIRGQVLWCLSNIAGDGPFYGEIILVNDAMKYILKILSEPNPSNSILRDTTWALSNLCRNQSISGWNQIKESVPHLARMLYMKDEFILADTCWALSYISEGDSVQLNALIDIGVCPQVVELINHPSLKVQVPALRVCGNIVVGDEKITQVMLNLGFLDHLKILLNTTNKHNLLKEACWAISNITAGSRAQIQQVIDIGLIPILVHFAKGNDSSIANEAVLALTNASSGSMSQIRSMVSQGALDGICANLKNTDVKVLLRVLEAIDDILDIGSKDKKMPENAYIDMIEVLGGLNIFEELQNKEHPEISQAAYQIISKNFSTQT